MKTSIRDYAANAILNTRCRVTAIVMAAAYHLGLTAGATDWIPAQDAALDAFATNFDTLITADPTTYALTAPDAVAFNINRVAYTNALVLSTDPTTSTSVTVAAKDAAKAVLKTNLRTLAALVQASPAVTNENKTALGLPIHSDTPSPIPAPSTMPLISIVKAGVLTHELRYSDELTPDSSRKPSDAIAMELYVEVSATPIVDQELVAYNGLQTRNPVILTYDADDKGKQAYLCGRWINARGDRGPWSALSNFTVAA